MRQRYDNKNGDKGRNSKGETGMKGEERGVGKTTAKAVEGFSCFVAKPGVPIRIDTDA